MLHLKHNSDSDKQLQQSLQIIRDTTCPYDVDVVNQVMAIVPTLVPVSDATSQTSRRHAFMSVSHVLAACFILAVAVNVISLMFRSYDEPQIATLITDVYSYSYSEDCYLLSEDNGLINTLY